MNQTTRNFQVKLKKLENQIRAARLADYAYQEGEFALEILLQRTRHHMGLLEQSDGFSAPVREAALQQINFFIMRVTHIIGIIVRSTSIRNAFELYIPFLDISRALLSDTARLILSSEWQYVPFTHPQNVTELPDFIIIGLPASESDNVLIFPTAGHELGHSVWAKHNIESTLAPIASRLIDEEFVRRRKEIEETFPDTKGAAFDQDMFVQRLKAACSKSTIGQAEEIFSDFVGLVLFGESFLFAFEYLVAPRLSGARAKLYPDTKVRADIMADYARQKFGTTIEGYSMSFAADAEPADRRERLLLQIADVALKDILPKLFDRANGIITSSRVNVPTQTATNDVEASFAQGIPFAGDAAIGDLINASWRIFRQNKKSSFERQGRDVADYVCDLVLKSAEIHEIRKYTS